MPLFNHLSFPFDSHRHLIFLILLVLPITTFASTISIVGTGDSQALLRDLAAEFTQQTGIRVEVPDSVGSGGGIKALINGKTELARTARPLKSKERPGLVEVEFGRSPVVIATHPSVSNVTSITSEQLLGIFSGRIANWKELGGPDHKIYVVQREKGDSSHTVIANVLAQFDTNAAAGITIYNTPKAVRAVADNPYTVGIMPLSYAQANHLLPLSVDGNSPLDPAYPFITTFYVVYKGQPGENARRFVDFLFSKQAGKYMKSLGVVPVANTPNE